VTRKYPSDDWLQQLSKARANFSAGDALPFKLLPAAVARSWARSRDAGVTPSQAPWFELLDRSRSKREASDDKRLYRCVVDEIEYLWDAFGGKDWTIFCVNPQGTVVHARRSPACDQRLLLPIVSGRRILESHLGTTAPSCALHEGAAVIVERGQHYLDEFESLCCVSVPLFGLNGEVIGALNMTGIGPRDVQQVARQFRLAASAVEQRIFATLRGCHLLRLQHDPRWLSTPIAGVLAVDEDGQLRAASRIARQMLSLPPDVSLTSVDLGELFKGIPPLQTGQSAKSQCNARRVVREDGSHLWVQHASGPRKRGTTRTGMVPGDDTMVAMEAGAQNVRGGTMQERTLDAIQRAIREHGGNIASVARALRISRTTVYRKLQQLREMGIVDD
jgi:transcriptional regulator of acetoin/glycerol metabolism